MTLHPIAIVDQVLAEYRAYLATEFRASDERLRQALERALDEPRFLAQEPFFQAHRPFKDGSRWDALGLDAALAKGMARRAGQPHAYLHQSTAIAHLLGAHPSPLVVTTGTGSGKTECFLLPVIQNAIADSSRFDRRGVTAILVYPMNALANDQEERIRLYLQESGHTHVSVARYDRTTQQDERERMRKSPPHILLTNYMMLEYLLVRPADRDALFANHRCRFLVLDEVHTYRGALGSNIALLFRRLLAHLRNATQDWRADDRSDPVRFPEPVPVATSATIKSVDETGRTREEIEKLRNEAVQGFFARLTGAEPASIRVIGEEVRDVSPPPEARWAAQPAAIAAPDFRDHEAVRRALCALAGAGEGLDLAAAARSAAILWKLGDLLARRPLSLTGLVARIRAEVPERRDADETAVRREVEAALVAGAALPDDVPGALRLRTHRFVRGGWRFHRCVDLACGRLYPMGEERCGCGRATAPLYLCRSCGADTLRFAAEGEPEDAALRPNDAREARDEWLLYDWGRFGEAANAEEDVTDREMKGREVKQGSFDPASCSFSSDDGLYPVKAVLAPGRNRCLVCGAWAGAGSILTPVALGTSAAVRVLAEGLVESLAEQNRARDGHDGKERLLIFADSRQDAAHQARFITYAGRYDRMRRRLVEVLRHAGQPLGIDAAIRALMVLGVRHRDNRHTTSYDDPEYLPDAVQARAKAWEEALLLDDLAVGAGYRSTVLNLGLVGVRYDKLDAYVEKQGGALAQALGISTGQLLHLCRCLLDEMRRRGALSRPLLRYHPLSPSCPDEIKPFVTDWERRFQSPTGYACDDGGSPVRYRDTTEAPEGITLANPWRSPGKGGRDPSLQRQMKSLLKRFGGIDPDAEQMLDVLGFLCDGPRLLAPAVLHGHKKTMTLLQVNADAVQLALLRPEERMRCSVCSVRMPWAAPGAPCPRCHSTLRPWPEAEIAQNRFVARIRKADLLPLHAGEHTAQITGEARIQLEEDFKAAPSKSPTNVLACSPTLEMGIDVGGLDAVVMRNVPPRPDNYAQRGGRAGRRSRVGVVLGYARSTPHDGYFFDRPEEMIAGEVPAPGLGLGSRDVVLRHLHAIAFGAADPGLSGRMADYVTLQGGLVPEKIDELLAAVTKRFEHAADLALEAWGPEVLEPAGLASKEALLTALGELPGRIRNLFDRVRLQIVQLEETIKRWQELGRGDRVAVNAMELKRRLLGIRGERDTGGEADDRTSGHPMRRFAEFGILPGYEFPSEPATVRLLGDAHEEEPVTVERRFGIAQYQPEARAHARGHRWQVIGLDLSSPWNPKTPEPGWLYTLCKPCKLRYGAQEHVQCPRCGSGEAIGNGLPAFEYGGFLARRDDAPVLDEEERFATANLVQMHPQRTGDVVARYALPMHWQLELRAREDVRWLNEWKPPTETEKAQGKPMLHDEGRGFYLCSGCGRVLRVPDPTGKKKGRSKAKKGGADDPYEHGPGCLLAGEPPRAQAIVARGQATTLRLRVPLPLDVSAKDYQEWGLSLGYALRIGLRHLYMLDGPEVEFVLEPSWPGAYEGRQLRHGALTLVDPAVGGSGFLDRAARELHLVARRALEHLEHEGCESACYRCLKSYNNQRFHEQLSWPRIAADLEELASQPPSSLAPELGDVHDPGPWLEAFDAGVGSPLELRFLRLFEEHGLAVEKQVPVAPADGEPPISTADFVVPGARVAIYVDGAAFHRGERLRRDRRIRERLRSGAVGWRVVELRAGDLSRGAAIVDEIRTLEKG